MLEKIQPLPGAQRQAELFPRHHAVDLDQRVPLDIQARLNVRKIGKPICAIAPFPVPVSHVEDTAAGGLRQFSEVPRRETSSYGDAVDL